MRVVALLLLGVLLGIGGYLFLTNAKKKTPPPQIKQALVSGSINLNGAIPNNATMIFLQRESSTTSAFTRFEAHPGALDDKQWLFTTAVEGKSYEIKAALRLDGKTLVETCPIFITAPAKDEVLHLNIPLQPNITPAETTISGAVGINGYIPDGETVVIESRIAQAADFATVAQNIPAKDEQRISFISAMSGKQKEVSVLLLV